MKQAINQEEMKQNLFNLFNKKKYDNIKVGKITVFNDLDKSGDAVEYCNINKDSYSMIFKHIKICSYKDNYVNPDIVLYKNGEPVYAFHIKSFEYTEDDINELIVSYNELKRKRCPKLRVFEINVEPIYDLIDDDVEGKVLLVEREL